MNFLKTLGLVLVMFLSISFLAAQDAAPSGGQQQYQLLSAIPGLDALNTSTGDFTSFINTIYRMSIGIGSALAVIMIIFAGIQYSMSAVAGEKAKLKDKITMALGGLGLLLGAFVFLNFVNPNLTELNNKGGNLSDITFIDAAYEPIEVTTIDEVTGDEIGGAYDVPLGTRIWVPEGGSNSEYYETEQECLASGDPREPQRCQQVTNGYSPGIPPEQTNEMAFMTSAHPGYRLQMNSENIAPGEVLDGWPLNPYRRPIDYASKGNGQVSMSKYVIETDRYIQDTFQTRFNKTVSITSAYRDPAHNARCCGTTRNHQTGYALDYNIAGFSQEQLSVFQTLALETGAKYLGFGPSSGSNRMFHVQWGGRSDTPVYWCYSEQRARGPYKGANSTPGIAKGGSCAY